MSLRHSQVTWRQMQISCFQKSDRLHKHQHNLARNAEIIRARVKSVINHFFGRSDYLVSSLQCPGQETLLYDR